MVQSVLTEAVAFLQNAMDVEGVSGAKVTINGETITIAANKDTAIELALAVFNIKNGGTNAAEEFLTNGEQVNVSYKLNLKYNGTPIEVASTANFSLSK